MQSLMERIIRLERSIMEKDEELIRLRSMVQTDQMTSLLNRSGFSERLLAMLSQQSRSGGSTFVVFLDVDDFKRLNTDFGHDGGDYALITLATRFKAVMRAHDIVGRWSGDEFVIAFHLSSSDILENVHRSIITRLDEFIHEPIVYKNKDMRVTCSIGVVHYDGNALVEVDEIIKAADKAMFLAKNSGKNGTKEIPFSLSA